MSELKISCIGIKPYHLDSIIQESIQSTVLNLDKRYTQAQFKFLMQYAGFSYKQIVLKVILNNISSIESIVISDPVGPDSDHDKGFVGAIEDLNYDTCLLFVYDENGTFYNISPDEIDKINFNSYGDSEKVNSYIHNERSHCLKCESIKCFNFSDLYFSGNSIFQYVVCKNCKAEWVCEYGLSYVHTNIQ